ncbi:MAG: YebC/PmpR family DNA-binding transcriptional regulator [Opitutia bacterium]|nr:YebC/PmpR family DNA-binding transcriptional regulator [Opitutales bacterium]PHX69047.1 MAG: YebC/PmpR family DNA-binding transcriptional regulator [Opitutae bacterium]
MSGHSKWHTTKRHKAVIDAKRGKVFSVLAKEITLAARSGGGNAETNVRLRTLMDKARASNMPTDNIKRAIQKGTGEIPGVVYDEITYEGYAPGGVGLIVEVTTDNKNRAAAEVRQAFNDNSGNMAQTGAVSHSFQRKGQFLIGANQTTEDQLMEIALEAGADDIINHGDHFEVLCPVSAYDSMSKTLQEKAMKPESSEIAYITNIPVSVTDAEIAKKVLELIETLEALDDVKAVHGNHEIDPKFLG